MRKPIFYCLALALAFLFCVPASVHAAAVEITDSVTADFNKTAAAAELSLKGKMIGNYSNSASLQQLDTDWEAKVKAIHDKNEEADRLLRKQLKEIHAAKISRLQTEVNAVKDKYKPLFERYTALNKYIAAVKPLKNKELNSLLRLQADTMRPAVALARQEIKSKETALKKAKDIKNQTVKKIRGTLAEAEAVELKIKAEKSAISASKKSITAAWKNFRHHIKKRNAKSAANSLASLLTLSLQSISQKQKVYSLELKISGVIAKAKAQMP